MQDFEECADRFFNALFVTSLGGSTKANSFRYLFIAIAVRELVVKGLGQVIGNEAIITCQILTAILGHFPARQIARKAIQHCQIEFPWQW